MKKLLFSLIVAFALILSGCARTESSVPADIPQESTQEVTAETIYEPAQTAESAPQTEKQAFPEPMFRESSLYFARADSEGAEEDFLIAASAKKERPAEEMRISRGYKTKEGVRYDYDVTTDGIYFIARAFVDFRSADDISVIIDPAYMYDVPMPSLKDVPAENYTFDINGSKIICDSLYFNAQLSYDEQKNEEKWKDFHTDGYCYADVTMKVKYIADTNGFEVKGSLISMEEAADVETVLDVCTLGSDAFDEKSEAAAETYKALLTIKDRLIERDIMGVNLIDLDFDGTPEVLVSRKAKIFTADTYCDEDIYRIENSGLVLVDTLFNANSGLMMSDGNVIGLKLLENGEKAWFTMSRFRRGEPESDPAFYLFTMKDGRLEFTEVFRCERTLDDDGMATDVNYYMNGEKLQFGIEYDYDPHYRADNPYWADAKPDWPYYTYGGHRMPFEGALYDQIVEDYCADIEQNFSLYSDEFSVKIGFSSYAKLPVTERMIGYKLAYLTDAFYFGDYDPVVKDFVYRFNGGYDKPVIYLYPTEATDVTVKVEPDGGLTCAYPDYRGGWNVTAYPDGTLVDSAGREYYCLYWEGESAAEWDMSRGEVVRGEDTAQFLDEKLAEIGLNARERNEFIIYWLPRMQRNEYNYITFHTEDYAATVPLEVTPQPDSVLRVFMVYAGVPEYFETQPQQFGGFERSGFTLVEWGGGEATVR